MTERQRKMLFWINVNKVIALLLALIGSVNLAIVVHDGNTEGIFGFAISIVTAMALYSMVRAAQVMHEIAYGPPTTRRVDYHLGDGLEDD